jgi:hypothetical protein
MAGQLRCTLQGDNIPSVIPPVVFLQSGLSCHRAQLRLISAGCDCSLINSGTSHQLSSDKSDEPLGEVT